MSVRNRSFEQTYRTRTIVIIVAHHNLLHFTVFTHLAEEVFVKGIEVVLQLRRVHLILRVEGRVLVKIREENSLRV